MPGEANPRVVALCGDLTESAEAVAFKLKSGSITGLEGSQRLLDYSATKSAIQPFRRPRCLTWQIYGTSLTRAILNLRTPTRMPPTVEFRQGAIELLILRTLSWGPQHGFSIARWIQDTTQDALCLEEGSLYPALHRMEDKGWVGGEWGTSENRRRAKFYRLTPAGRRQLTSETRDWWRYADAVALVLRATVRPAAV